MRSSYAYILAAVLGYLVAHTIKYFLQPKHKRTWKRWVQTGNFPSSHTAVVVALVTAIFVHEGVSTLFAVAGVFAAITIQDALSSRRSIGEQGTVLSKLLEKVTPGEPAPYVAIGHTLKEVVAGAAIGVVLGVVVALFITI
ncbi:MAG TPA: divergent PAP2 family protein [Candidatus Saccharibacteria bacterium]|nr:divergent PAP2 family protein [Candidatus Saccharibacteria bacterium]